MVGVECWEVVLFPLASYYRNSERKTPAWCWLRLNFTFARAESISLLSCKKVEMTLTSNSRGRCARESNTINQKMFTTFYRMHLCTFLPARLLCLFITARGLLPLALASVNCSENQLPNLMLLLQPDHVQPFWVTPLRERSQSQLSIFPALHEAVTA